MNQHVECPFHFPAQGADLQVKVPLATSPTQGVQAENLRPFQKLNQRLVQVVGDGL